MATNNTSSTRSAVSTAHGLLITAIDLARACAGNDNHRVPAVPPPPPTTPGMPPSQMRRMPTPLRFLLSILSPPVAGFLRASSLITSQEVQAALSLSIHKARVDIDADAIKFAVALIREPRKAMAHA